MRISKWLIVQSIAPLQLNSTRCDMIWQWTPFHAFCSCERRLESQSKIRESELLNFGRTFHTSSLIHNLENDYDHAEIHIFKAMIESSRLNTMEHKLCTLKNDMRICLSSQWIFIKIKTKNLFWEQINLLVCDMLRETTK